MRRKRHELENRGGKPSLRLDAADHQHLLSVG
jgi:hypothetical protein